MTENNEAIDDSSATESTETRDIVEQQFNKLEDSQAVEQQAQASEQPEPQQTEAQTAQPERDPWKSWKKEAAEKLSALPGDVQQHIIDRENQFHKGIEQYKEAANYAKTIDKAIAPYKDYLNQLGVSPDVAFPNLLKTEKTLRTGSPAEKAEMFQKLAHDYGIDLHQIVNVPFDPQLANYKQQLEWTQQQLQASRDFQQSHEDAKILNTIESFQQTAEHFDEVRLDMANLLESGLATSLQDAYNKAIRLNDNVYQKQQQIQQFGSANAGRLNQAAQAARAAAVSVKGSPVGVKNATVPKDTEDAVRQAFAGLGL